MSVMQKTGMNAQKNDISAPKNAAKKRHKKKRHLVVRPLLIVFLAALAVLIGSGAFAYRYYYYPSTELSVKVPAKVILYDTAVPATDYRMEGDSLLLGFDFVKANLDPSIYWEAESNKIVVTTADKVIEMDTGELTAYVNSQAVSIDVPVTLYDNVPFVPVDFLASIYGYQIELLDSGITVIDNLKEPVLSMTVKTGSYAAGIPYLQDWDLLTEPPCLRESPLFRSPRIKELAPGDNVVVVGEDSDWYKVRTSEGLLGYIKKNQTVLKEIIPIRYEEAPYVSPWKPIGQKINLTWDYMSKAKNDMSGYTPINGLNVISPTWFSLQDAEGTIKNIGSVAYVQWAHAQGLQVWALFSNSFDPDITTPVLRSFDLRKKMIQQLLVFADSYGFDGINIDFEDVNYDDKDFLTQFIREMTPYLHEAGLTVSMDVTILSTNPNWSMVYDRASLSKVLDYMAVMTYDEHWSSSPVSGSVASLPWVENSLSGLLEQIPAEKLLLGVPFYARVWEETLQTDGSIKVSSKAYSMTGINKIIDEKNVEVTVDEETGQHYGFYTEGNSTFRIWIEDEYSMRQRVAIVQEYSLAGIASWRKGFETPDIWDVIAEGLK